MKGIKRDWELPIFSCIRRMTKTNLKLCQKVTWMRMRASSVQQFLVPRARRQQGSSIRPGMPGLPSSSGNLWFLLVGKGLVLPRASLESSGMPWGAAQGDRAGGTYSGERCDGKGCGDNQRHWWLWFLGWKGDLGVLERKFWSGGGGERSPLAGQGQGSQLGDKKLQGNLCLVKSPEDGNTKADPTCRVPAHVSRQVRRGPHALQRRCPIYLTELEQHI